MINPCGFCTAKSNISSIICAAAAALCLIASIFPSPSYALSDNKLLVFDFVAVNADASCKERFNSKLKRVLEEKGFKVIAVAGVRDRKMDGEMLKKAAQADDYAKTLSDKVQAKRFIKGEFGIDAKGLIYVKGYIYNAEKDSRERSFERFPQLRGGNREKNILALAEYCAEKIYDTLAYALPGGQTAVLLISLGTGSMEEEQVSDATSLLERKLNDYGLFNVNRNKTADSDFHLKYRKDRVSKIGDRSVIYRSAEEFLMQNIACNGGTSKILFGNIDYTGKRYSLRLELHDSANNRKLYYFDKRGSLKGDIAGLIDCAAKDFIKNYIFTDKCRHIKLDINSASLETIELLPGMSRKTAGNVVDYRRENGDFSCLDDMEYVPGITPKHIEKFRGFVKCSTKEN